MTLILHKHPIPMKTLFKRCFLVNFAIDPNVIQSLLPAPLVPDLYRDRAFLSIVIADMEQMRPAFLPSVFGITYNQVVYRVMVRCQGERGVYFIRSDADNRFMCMMGNLMTFFKFHHSSMSFKTEGGNIHFDLMAGKNHEADIHAVFETGRASHTMPATSRFKTVEEAQPFIVEQYAAYAVPQPNVITRVRIQRSAWDIKVVNDLRSEYQFMQIYAPFSPANTQLDSIFYVENIPYYWYTLEKLSPS